jgi:hypothetical protein
MMSSPPILVWTSWSPTNSSAEGASLGRVIFGPGPSFQIWNAGWDAHSLNAVMAGCKVVFNEMNLGLDDSELVGVSVPLDFGSHIPVVKVGDGTTECVVCWSGAVKEGVEPNRDWLGNVR